MAVTQAVLPSRRTRWRAESTTASVTLAALGAGGLLLVAIAVLVLPAVRGATPVASLVRTLRSGTMSAVLVAGVAVGAIAGIAGWIGAGRMPTKLAREQAIAGAVLGLQAVIFGSILLRFVHGDVSKFATNFLDFHAMGAHLGDFANGAKNTLFLALGGEGIGIVLGMTLAVFASSRRVVVRAPARAYVNFFRATPLIWQLSFIYFGLSIGFGVNLSAYVTAIATFGLNTGAYAAEIFRAGIQSIERGQLEAARGLGMSYLQALRYAVIPQAVRRVIPPLMNEFVILIKDTSLVIILGLTFKQYELFTAGRSLFSITFNPSYFVATAIGYLVVTLPLIRLVTAVEHRLRSGLVGVVGRVDVMGER